MISFPIEARVVHLQLLVARTAHRLWALNLHTSHESPCDVTPDNASRHTLQYVGRACEQAYQLCIPEKWSMLYWVDSKCSRFCTVFSAAIQSSISFLLSAQRMSFRHGVIIFNVQSSSKLVSRAAYSLTKTTNQMADMRWTGLVPSVLSLTELCSTCHELISCLLKEELG